MRSCVVKVQWTQKTIKLTIKNSSFNMRLPQSKQMCRTRFRQLLYLMGESGLFSWRQRTWEGLDIFQIMKNLHVSLCSGSVALVCKWGGTPALRVPSMTYLFPIDSNWQEYVRLSAVCIGGKVIFYKKKNLQELGEIFNLFKLLNKYKHICGL